MAVDPLWRLKGRLRLRDKLRLILPGLDVLAAIPTAAAGSYFRLLKRLGLNEMRLNKRVLEALGVWPVLRHYYEPYFDRSMLRRPLDQPRELPGLDLQVERSLRLVDRLAPFGNEPIVGEVAGGRSYVPDNGTFGLPDAALLYAFIRLLKPKRLFEIGSGNSTLVAIRALARNRAEGGRCQHLCIEPFEMGWLENCGVTVRREMIEDVDPALFDQLEAGDILFVDNSHVVRPQGDVVTVIQTILPRLRPGVVVHIHDMLTPRDYLSDWLVDNRTFWTEQYLVEAFLTCNGEFETLFAANHIYVDHRDEFDRLRPELAGKDDHHPPTSFWLWRADARSRWD